MNNSIHLWSEQISLVEEWISLASNSTSVKIHYSSSGIPSDSLDIHSKRSDHWRHYPRNENRVKIHSFLFREYCTHAVALFLLLLIFSLVYKKCFLHWYIFSLSFILIYISIASLIFFLFSSFLSSLIFSSLSVFLFLSFFHVASIFFPAFIRTSSTS